VRHADGVEQIETWRGEVAEVARSPSGVLLLCDYADNLLGAPGVAWPPPALVAKLVADGRVSGTWPESLLTRVSARLGYYCPLQSINSEDAITWSYFGSLMYGGADARLDFMSWLLKRIGLPAGDTVCTVDLWRRIPHPQKPAAPGPELDVLLQGDRSVVYVEAKWGSPEGTGQGPGGTATQMGLRRDFLDNYGAKVYGDRRFAVVGAVVQDPVESATPPDTASVVTRTITWQELSTFGEHPMGGEFGDYLAWKRVHSSARC
jgi:hypothetical protein